MAQSTLPQITTGEPHPSTILLPKFPRSPIKAPRNWNPQAATFVPAGPNTPERPVPPASIPSLKQLQQSINSALKSTRSQPFEKRLIDLRIQQAEIHRLRALAHSKKRALESNVEGTQSDSGTGHREEISGERDDVDVGRGQGIGNGRRQIEDLELCGRWLLDLGKALLGEIQELEAEAITRQLE